MVFKVCGVCGFLREGCAQYEELILIIYDGDYHLSWYVGISWGLSCFLKSGGKKSNF